MQAEVTENAVSLVNTGDGRYIRYFGELQRAMSMLLSWTGTFPRGALLPERHEDYIRGLSACFGIFESRYAYEFNDSLMVDLSNSGYPHSYMTARIATDRADALSAHIKGAALSSANLKQVFLDDLFDTGDINRALLNRIASARYAEVVACMDGVFDPRFMCGKPESGDGMSKKYTLQWSVFDPVINVPVLCGMMFEYSGMDLPRSLESLKSVLRYETKADISISALARAIDSGTSDINPVTMSRAILGPLHLPGLTESGTSPCTLKSVPIGQAVMVEIVIDHTSAVSVKKPSSLAVRFGVSPQMMQVYAVRSQDPLCYERGAEAVERIIILPHRFVQGIPLKERNDDWGEFTLVPYIKEGELQ